MFVSSRWRHCRNGTRTFRSICHLIDDGEGKDEKTSKAMPAAAPAEKTTGGIEAGKAGKFALPPLRRTVIWRCQNICDGCHIIRTAPLAVAESRWGSKTEPRSVNSPATSEVGDAVAETKVASVVTTVENTAASAVAVPLKENRQSCENGKRDCPGIPERIAGSKRALVRRYSRAR